VDLLERPGLAWRRRCRRARWRLRHIGLLVELIRGEARAGRHREVFIERVTAIFEAQPTESGAKS